MTFAWRTRGRCHVFGDDLAHDNVMMAWCYVIERVVDPEVLVPALFQPIDPDFVNRVRRGDFIVAGRNFGAGKPHTTAFIAMNALGLRVLCESSFQKILRGAANLGVPIMTGCVGLWRMLESGEEIEVDMSTGEVVLTRSGQSLSFPPVPPAIRQIVEEGGRKGFLRKWLEQNPWLAEPAE